MTVDELVSLVRDVAPDRLPSMQHIREIRIGSLSCPRCTTRMTVIAFGGVQLDRCAAHGLWFERGDLEKALGGGADAVAAFHQDWQEHQGETQGRSLGTIIRGWFRFRWRR